MTGAEGLRGRATVPGWRALPGDKWDWLGVGDGMGTQPGEPLGLVCGPLDHGWAEGFLSFASGGVGSRETVSG